MIISRSPISIRIAWPSSESRKCTEKPTKVCGSEVQLLNVYARVDKSFLERQELFSAVGRNRLSFSGPTLCAERHADLTTRESPPAKNLRQLPQKPRFLWPFGFAMISYDAAPRIVST